MSKRYRRGWRPPRVYRGSKWKQRDPNAISVPRMGGAPASGEYHGPPEEQKNPWAVNRHGEAKD